MTLENDTSKRIKELHSKVARLLSSGWSKDEIISELAKENIDSDYALTVIENIENDKADKISFRNSVIMGSFYIGGGLLLNYFSYQIGLNQSAFFFYVFWGIIVLGIVTFIRGYLLYLKK